VTGKPEGSKTRNIVRTALVSPAAWATGRERGHVGDASWKQSCTPPRFVWM